MLIVEDGSGLPNAESYCSVAFADAYFAARNVSSWDGSTEHREGLLRIATEYMLGQYQFVGERVKREQALDWPRVDAWAYGFPIDSNTVPEAIMRACAELAHRANHSTLQPDIGKRTIREKVDVIEVEYSEGSRESTYFAQVDRILMPFLESTSSGINRSVIRS